MKRVIILLYLLVVHTILFLYGQPVEKKTYQTLRIQGEVPQIDGKLDEPAWTLASWENGFTQHEPYEGQIPSQKSAFAVLYDDYSIFVGMKLFDTAPDSIVRRLTRRDQIDGDVAGVEFDSYNDKRTAFAFAVTASGVKYDFIVSNDGNNEDDTWNPIWWVEVSHDTLGWYAEMRIPLTQLRFGETSRQEWGFEVIRFLFRKEETSLWQPVIRKQPSFVSQFGRITGFKDIESRNIVDVMPYVVARTEQFEKEPENPFRGKGYQNSLDAGLDAKIGVTNYLTLDLTVNPDFGQVEADPSEVNLSAYETFFEERRPFFIEGKNILHYGLNFGDGDLSDEGLFYSRRIGRKPQYSPKIKSGSYSRVPAFTRILGAAKISGKTAGGWSVGLLESMTAKEIADVRNLQTENKVPVEPFTNYAVARIQKDFDQGNTYFGGMVTSVNRALKDDELLFLHHSAYTGGLDFVHKWNDKNWEFDASFYGSRVAGTPEAIVQTQRAWTHLFQRPDAAYLGVDSSLTSLSGFGGKIVLGEYGGKLRFLSAVSFKSPGLELNDVGYLRESDNILQVVWIGYRIFDPVWIFRQFYANVNQWTEWNFGGVLNATGGNLNLHANFMNYWSFDFGSNLNLPGVSMNALRGGPALKYPGSFDFFADVGSNEQKKLTFEADGYFNGSFEKDFSQSQGAEIEIAYRPVNALKLSFSPEYNHSTTSLQYITQKEVNGISRYIFGNLERNTLNASFRVNLNLSPELTIQYWGQPFVASGKYSRLKRITDSMADEVNNRFAEYSDTEIVYDSSSEKYLISEPGWGQTEIDQPDFNVKELLSNMVVRWEYNPGSTLYLVWSQDRSSSVSDGSFALGRDIDRLFGTKPGNIFLVKFSYRFGR